MPYEVKGRSWIFLPSRQGETLKDLSGLRDQNIVLIRPVFQNDIGYFVMDKHEGA